MPLNLFFLLFKLCVAGLVTVGLMQRLRWDWRGKDPAPVAAVGAGITFLLIPPIYFLLAALTLQFLTWAFLVAVTALLIVLLRKELLGAWRARAQWRCPGWGTLAWLAPGWIALIFQFLAFDTTLNFHLWCTYCPVGLAATPGFLDPGEVSVNANLLYPGHQRLGIASFFGLWFADNGLLGLRLAWGGIFATLSWSIQALMGLIGVRPWVAFVTALVAGLLPGIAWHADQNRVILALSLWTVLLIVELGARRALVGFLLGLLWTCEPVLALGFPAFAVLVVQHQRGQEISWKPFVSGFVVATLPALLRYRLAFGSLLFHEHFSYVPKIEYSFLGIPFHLAAFLNWPFREELIRSNYNPLPNLALVPLTVMSHWGIFLALVIVGLTALALRRHGKVLVPSVLWFFPLFAFLAVNENWTQKDKWGIVTMAYGSVLVWFGVGLEAVARSWKRGLAVACLAAGGLVLLHDGLVRLDAKEDPLFRREWAAAKQIVPEEEPDYMAIEREGIRRLTWLPSQPPGSVPVTTYLQRNLLILQEQLRSGSVFRRTFTLAETIVSMLTWKDAVLWRPALPAPIDPVPAQRSVRLDRPLSTWLAPGREASAVRVADANVDRGYPLRPYDPLIAMQPPWAAQPLHVGLVLFGPDLAVLVIVRVLANDFVPQPLVADQELLLHYPEGRKLYVLDIVSLDPSREYAFSEEGVLPDGRVKMALTVLRQK